MKNYLYRLFFLGSKTYFLKSNIVYVYSSWKKCNACSSFLFYPKIINNHGMCYKCSFHFNISSRNRANLFLDCNYVEIYDGILPVDVLDFFDTKHYYSRIVEAQMNTEEIEALLILKGKIGMIDVILCVFEFGFIAGSMGQVVGNKFSFAIKFAIKNKLPVICISTSGGVRMQESVISLFQMSKVASMIKYFATFSLPYLSIIVNPCMGGVSASIAMLGDIIVAEPKALIGFTGPKVIKKITGKNLSNNFQSSEFLFKNGFIDFIVDRKNLRSKILNILKILMKI